MIYGMRHSGSYFGLTSGTGIPTVLTTVHRIPSTSSKTCCDKGVSGSKNWILSQPPSRSTAFFTSLFRSNGLNRKYGITLKRGGDSSPTASIIICWKIISLSPATYSPGNSPRQDFPNHRPPYTRYYGCPREEPPIRHLRHPQNRPDTPLATRNHLRFRGLATMPETRTPQTNPPNQSASQITLRNLEIGPEED